MPRHGADEIDVAHRIMLGKRGSRVVVRDTENEMYYRQSFATKARARFAVAEYIEAFYNRRRMHSSIGYRTPAQALNDYRTAAQAA
jgi:transposase InsO family protein